MHAVALGAMATAEEGKKWMEVHGIPVKACKSDVLLTVVPEDKATRTAGISVKQCNNRTPTNAQLYFTTAHGFCDLLRRNHIPVSRDGEVALKQFCGDPNFVPRDVAGRRTDPRRYFWEETNEVGRKELERTFGTYQDEITRLLLQKAYLNDPFTPEFLIHKTRQVEEGPPEYALCTIDDLVTRSRAYQGFCTRPYSVRKGRYRDPPGIVHQAPRFGIVQMQRGGQEQHPTQLQFNLEAGYFYKI